MEANVSRRPIEPAALRLDPVGTLLNRWMVLTAGDYDAGEYNAMTVAWGFVGAMWNRPMAIAAVRPTRHTFGFMNRYSTWTLCAFPASFREDLSYLGKASGRDGDKVARTGLDPTASRVVAAPSFVQAELIIECRTMYVNEITPEGMKDAAVDRHYDNDYHHMYYGEIVAASGTEAYGE